MPTLATIPLLLAIPGMSFTDAYFEAVSGLTTSGATVLTGLDGLAPSINIWRTLMVWLGGMGIIVLAVAILPMLGIGGSQLFKAESPGCMKDTKLTPRIEETAKGLWGVYAAVTLACIASLHLAGMTWVDAVVHGFSTMGLGGFSSHDASFAHFNSATIEAVTTFFMLAASLNFAIHFLALRRRSLGPYAEDTEARWVLAWLGVSCAGIAAFLLAKGTYPDFWTALRHASFNVVSIASTTGFASVDFAQWPVFAPVWMIFLSSFVTSSGSTGGGIKLVRALVLLKQSFRELTRIIHPSAVLRIKLGTQVIENNVIFAVLAFMLMYGGTIIMMTMLLLASGPRLHHRRHRGDRLHQQHGPGAGPGGAVDDLPGAHGLPDLGLHRDHAARAAGDVPDPRPLHAGVLAEVVLSRSATGGSAAARLLVERLDLAPELDEQRVAVAVHGLPGRHLHPALADAVLLHVLALVAVQADADVVLEHGRHVVGAARVDGQVVGKGRAFGGGVHGVLWLLDPVNLSHCRPSRGPSRARGDNVAFAAGARVPP